MKTFLTTLCLLALPALPAAETAAPLAIFGETLHTLAGPAIKDGLVLVWMVQHAGFPGEGGKAQGAFRQAAVAAYGQK